MVVWIKRIGATFAVLLLLIAAFVGFCAFSYWNDMRIDETRGVNDAGYVKIGGIDQWIQIRGRDRNNPVLLWLNGGPGFSQIPRSYFYRAWEKDFTLVMWDPRGQGKTFARSGASVKDTMTIKQFTSDGIEVVEYLRAHLHKNKIILLGHSFGSMVGVHMVHERPNLFSAYVGTGQVTNLEEQAEAAYPLLIERAHGLGNKIAEQQLIAAGPPPYPSEGFTKWVWVVWGNQLDPMPKPSLPTPGELWVGITVGLLARNGLPPGAQFSQDLMWEAIMSDDLAMLGLKFDLPVVFIQGEEDRLTVSALVKDYYERIEAPSKAYVPLSGIGHLAIIFEPERVLGELVNRVRPLAATGVDGE